MSSTITQTSDSPWKKAGGEYEWSNQLPRNTNNINPQEEGTVNAFGGTAGLKNLPLNEQGISTLPTTPYLNSNQSVIGTENPFTSEKPFSFQYINKTPNISGPKMGISNGPQNRINTVLSSRIGVPKEVINHTLNNDTTFNYTDFNTILLSESQNRLKHLGNEANRHLLHMANNQRFYNLPLSKIVDNTILTVIAVFSDLLEKMKPEEVKKRKYMSYSEIVREYANIFIRKDRMIYIGVFLIFISLLFMVIFLSS